MSTEHFHVNKWLNVCSKSILWLPSNSLSLSLCVAEVAEELCKTASSGHCGPLHPLSHDMPLLPSKSRTSHKHTENKENIEGGLDGRSDHGTHGHSGTARHAYLSSIRSDAPHYDSAGTPQSAESQLQRRQAWCLKRRARYFPTKWPLVVAGRLSGIWPIIKANLDIVSKHWPWISTVSTFRFKYLFIPPWILSALLNVVRGFRCYNRNYKILVRFSIVCCWVTSSQTQMYSVFLFYVIEWINCSYSVLSLLLNSHIVCLSCLVLIYCLFICFTLKIKCFVCAFTLWGRFLSLSLSAFLTTSTVRLLCGPNVPWTWQINTY